MIQVVNIIALAIPIMTVILTHFFVLIQNRKNKILEIEIESYKCLVKKLDDLVTNVSRLFPYGFSFVNTESDDILLSKSQRSWSEFYSEFIVDDFFLKSKLSNKLEEIVELAKTQIADFYFVKSQTLGTERNDCVEIYKKCVERNNDIGKCQEDFKEGLRNYIKTIK